MKEKVIRPEVLNTAMVQVESVLNNRPLTYVPLEPGSAEAISNQFWHRWVHEYLPTLTRRTKWFKSVTPLKIGDVVITVDLQKVSVMIGLWEKFWMFIQEKTT